jgi:hypothetical protein
VRDATTNKQLTAALPLSIVVSSTTGLGPLLPSAQCVLHPCVRSSTPFLSLSLPLSDCPTSSTSALSDCPASSTLASHCVVHCPIALRSVLCPPPLVVLFTAQLLCIACHPLVSYPPPPSCCVVPHLLALHCPPPPLVVLSTSCSPLTYSILI